MNCIFLGQDTVAKDKKIAEFKQRHLLSPEAFKFDYEVLHGSKLAPDILKKALMALPAVSQKRVILIRECHALNARNKKITMEFVRNQHEDAILILDSNELTRKDRFVAELSCFVKIIDFKTQAKPNVFDMTRAISMNRSTEALKILSTLFAEGIHPLQIMGALVWFWSKSRGILTPDNFKKGLLALQEADLNIKRSRMYPEHALELLVVKLLLLGGG